MPDLHAPLTIRETELPNRLVVSPMCQYCCDDDGLATEWHRVHLGSRAVGGAGVVMTEAAAVEPRGRITANDLGIWSEEHVDGLEPITHFVRDQGGVPGIQLAHAGHKASHSRPSAGSDPIAADAAGGWETLSPSPEANPYDETPAMRRATGEDLATVVDAFRSAAVRSLEAGFEIVEVHAAHGYLLHEFLSPATNHREDRYGGSFQNRTRLLGEVVDAVRDVWPEEKPVFVRISGTDWLGHRGEGDVTDEGPTSWTIEQSVRLAGELGEFGVDLIDVSSGGLHPDQQLAVGPNYQVPLAETIRSETDQRVGAVGKITTPQQADALVRNGRTDLVFVGRAFLRDPYFGRRSVSNPNHDRKRETWPVQYRRAVR